MISLEHCSCDPGAPAYDRCTKNWSRCNTRLHWMLTCSACGERQVAVGRGKCEPCLAARTGP